MPSVPARRPRKLPPPGWPRVGVKGVLFREGRVLLLRRAPDEVIFPGAWDLPGGLVEEGEGLEASLVREFQEETGLPVQVGDPVHAWFSRARLPSGRRVTTLVVAYRCTSRSTRTPRLDPHEHDQFDWVAPRYLRAYPGLGGKQVAIQKAVERLRRERAR